MKSKSKYSHSVEICLSHEGASDSCLKDMTPFKDLLDELDVTASKSTHYHKLDEWTSQVFGYVQEMLKKYDFKNGQPEVNEKNPDASFWWKIYSVVSNVIYSTHLETKVSSHHSSAHDRNSALIKDVDVIIHKFIKFEPVGKYAYDVFYVDGEWEVTGTTRGDNKKHATENFKREYGPTVKVKHLQRLSY